MSDSLNDCVYVFESNGENEISRICQIRKKLWQFGPSCIASLMCLPFGIMLGWPSPTYPKLIPKYSIDSPINITVDQSAMIAGFLMIGNTVGTPFSSISIIGAKYGISLGLMLMLIGWSIMRFATNIYFLLGSRLIVGLGCGYGMGQLKLYIKDMSQPPYFLILSRLTTLYMFGGVVIAFILGYFTNLTEFATAVIIFTTVVTVLSLLLPHSPKEYLKVGKEKEAIAVLLEIKTNTTADYEIQQMKVALDAPLKNISFMQVCRSPTTRKQVAIIWILTFLQQFTGAPATIIYTQIIFIESHCSYPAICAIAYAVLFVISNFIGMFLMDSFNKKSCLLFSCFSVILTLSINITVLYFNFNDTYWKFTSFASLCLFIFAHTVGLGVVPFLLTHELFPPEAVTAVSKFQVMNHSVLALIITKIFQVLYDVYSLYVPFCLFLSVSVVALVLIWFVVPYNIPVLDKSITLYRKPTQLSVL